MNAIELVILAAIAAFILYRLFSVLGQKTGYQGTQSSQDNVVPLRPDLEAEINEPRREEKNIPTHLMDSIESIKKMDPSFTYAGFVEGATVAFEMIIDAYAKGDKKTLKSLLNQDIFQAFKQTIEEREKEGKVLDTTLIKIESVDVNEINVNKNVAEATVQFVTEQILLIRDQAGEILEGNPNQIDQNIDTWAFQRDLKSDNPNWSLIKTSA